MPWTNYHSHCHYCDGKYEPEKYVESALHKGLAAYGYSSHAPLTQFDCSWTMKKEAAPAYVSEIHTLRGKYKDRIQIYCGMEVDYVPGLTGPKSKAILNLGLDYTIGSVHFVEKFPNGKGWEIDGAHTIFLDGLQQIFGGDIERAVTRYFELTRQMTEQECPDIIGHLDKIKIQDEDGKLFSEQADWYQKQMRQTLNVIADAGVIVEVNTRGIYKKKTRELYPSRWVLEKIHQLHIPITINSDAHHPDEIITEFEETSAILSSIGFQYVHALLDGEWQALKFNKKGLKIR